MPDVCPQGFIDAYGNGSMCILSGCWFDGTLGRVCGAGSPAGIVLVVVALLAAIVAAVLLLRHLDRER